MSTATRELEAQLAAVEAVAQAVEAKAQVEHENAKRIAEADRAIERAVVVAAKTGVARGKLAELVGFGRTKFRKVYGTAIDKARPETRGGRR